MMIPFSFFKAAIASASWATVRAPAAPYAMDLRELAVPVDVAPHFAIRAIRIGFDDVLGTDPSETRLSCKLFSADLLPICRAWSLGLVRAAEVFEIEVVNVSAASRDFEAAFWCLAARVGTNE